MKILSKIFFEIFLIKLRILQIINKCTCQVQFERLIYLSGTFVCFLKKIWLKYLQRFSFNKFFKKRHTFGTPCSFDRPLSGVLDFDSEGVKLDISILGGVTGKPLHVVFTPAV